MCQNHNEIRDYYGRKDILYLGNSGNNYDNSISGSIRKRASGGAGGYVGEFKNKSLGLYMMYATEKKGLVLVRCKDEIIVSNCKNRDELVEYAQQKLKKD